LQARIRKTVPAANAEAVAGAERIACIFSAKYSATAQAAGTFPVRVVLMRRAGARRWIKVREANAEMLAAGARSAGPEDARKARERLPVAEEIVRRIIATGRAHLDRADAPPLALGPARGARIAWTLAEDGTQRPSLEFERSEDRRAPAAQSETRRGDILGRTQRRRRLSCRGYRAALRAAEPIGARLAGGRCGVHRGPAPAPPPARHAA
jgi:hypothetical protein